MASVKLRSEIHALSVVEGHLLCQPGFLAKYQLPYMASNPSRSQVFLELVDMKMKIDSSAHSGL